MQLIVVTPTEGMNDAVCVQELFNCGLPRLHVRKPLFTPLEYREYLSNIEPQHYSKISIHNHFELFNEFHLGGVHINSNIRNDIAIKQQIEQVRPKVVSASFHGWQEAMEDEYPYNYFFISPVFDSISKKGYRAAINLDGANEIKQKLATANRYCPKIIGLGGVGVEQIKTLHQYGFDGVAMLGAIWESNDPVAVFREAMSIIDEL